MIDAHAAPLAAWQQRSAATGMHTLRSSAAHHLGLPARSLLHYAQDQSAADLLQGHYRRPALSLFNAHCVQVLRNSSINESFVSDQIGSIEPTPAGYRVVGNQDEWQTRRVVLALGPTPPHRPAWAAGHAHIKHVFDPGFSVAELNQRQPIVIVGGGLSAAQLALNLCARGHTPTLLMRHAIKVAEFDSDPCYLGPRCLREFHSTSDIEQRIAILNQARRPGSLPEQMAQGLHQAERANQLKIVVDSPVSYHDKHLHLANGDPLSAPQIVLATGFSDLAGAYPLAQNLIRDYDLPRAPNGAALTNEYLEWRPGLFVTGRLAELSLGPAAGNIAGARMAARRVLDYCEMPSAGPRPKR